MSRKRLRLDDLTSSRTTAACSGYRDASRNGVGRTSRQGSSSPTSPDTRYRKKPITTVDWRAELCGHLEQHHAISDQDLLDELDAAFHELKESRRLRDVQGNDSHAQPRYQVLYRIRCDESSDEDDESYETYAKPPWIVEAGPHDAHLRGGSPISNLELYLERNKDIVFLVYVDFVCCGETSVKLAQRPSDCYYPVEENALLLHTRESITVVSPQLKSALESLAMSALQDIPHPDFAKPSPDISYPYLWWFHRREQIDEAMAELDTEHQCYLSIMQDYIIDRLQKNWSKVDELVSNGLITLEHLEYIYVPGQVLINNTDDSCASATEGYQIVDWLRREAQSFEDSDIRVSSWRFDGTFNKVEEDLNITSPHVTHKASICPIDLEFEIESLSYYPERFARPEVIQGLLDCGKMFWKCRKRKYVSTPDVGGDLMHNSFGSRFMIDMETYKYMHPAEASKAEIPDSRVVDTIDPDVMDQDDPPLDESFFKCLPTTIAGFNMQKKEWSSLEVHCLREVQWNNQAFDYLVISQVTKELIKAVVMNQLSSQAHADLIRGKGNGLFMLLHGGPGTGKTLTAESVAEIAKRPLYRVTCGDIGTKAEDVEKYLEVVLYLGKTWGCVVLLDEADVFLEQRSLVNLERNALVSVFLRVLEYYDGILILTSNRVGIFDEAFRSRIQLSLRYNKLGENERHKIWENFLLHLEHFQQSIRARSLPQSQMTSLIGYGMDILDLRTHLDELSQANLNGREIRNALSIARQLALYRQETLQFHHLRDVMDEAKRFDDYLTKLNDGWSADDISSSRRER